MTTVLTHQILFFSLQLPANVDVGIQPGCRLVDPALFGSGSLHQFQCHIYHIGAEPMSTLDLICCFSSTPCQRVPEDKSQIQDQLFHSTPWVTVPETGC